MKFKSDIEVQAGIKDSTGSSGNAGSILSSTSTGVTWIDNYSDWTSVVKHVVKNNGVAVIPKGSPVYVTGSDGTNMLVGLAGNGSEATSSKTMGIVQTQLGTSGSTQTGYVITEGLLQGLNTAGRTAGDPIWLGPNGTLIYGLANKPYAPAHLVFIGIVTKISAGNGEIFVNVQNGFELNEIHDVDIKTNIPINGEVLGFDGTLWVNKTIAGWLGYVPADDAAVVHLTGSETITGAKYFTGTISSTISSSTDAIFVDNTGGRGVRISNNSTGFGLIINNGVSSTATPFAIQKSGSTVLSANDAGEITANKFIKLYGTAAQILAADGSVITAGTGITISGGTISASGTGYVPYIGATQDVDLGTYTLVAGKGVFSSSGSANTVEIGHSSGSGIALNITKGGNGEGLYINKTSGSGNAATIIGSASISADSTINGVNIGRGGGDVSGNTGVGLNTLNANTTGTDISAFGADSLISNTTGIANAANGSDSLRNNTTGSYNTGSGSDSLRNNTTGSYNTGSGEGALRYSVTGSYNSALGVDAGSLTSGGLATLTINNSVFIGAFTRALNQSGDTNQIVIGHDAVGLGSNTVTLGNTSVTTTRLRGAVLGGSFVKDGGTQDQYLKADGSVSTAMNSRIEVNFIATSGQTTFVTPYEVGQVDVYYNGSKLYPNEFTATNGTDIVLATGATLNAQISIVKYVSSLSTTAIRNETTFTTTAGQTTFAVNYSPGQVDVFYNGSKLNISEFTAVDGTSIVLGFACAAGESIVIDSYVNQISGASGTANKVAKFTGAASLGDSQIDDNGTNVSIGYTTNPNTYKLDVNGAGRFQNQLLIGNFNGQALKFQTATSTGNSYLRFYNSAGTSRGYLGLFHNGVSDYMLYDTGALEAQFASSNKFTFLGASLGIGTSNPMGTLHVETNGSSVRIGRTVGLASIKAISGADGNMIIDGDSAGAVFLNHYNAGNVYIGTGGGNVGIGTSSPGVKLEVNGLIRSIPVYNNTTATAANLVVSAGGTFERSTSSLKYKKEVRDYDKGLETLLKIRPVYYKGKSESDGDKQFAGLIAEEIHELGLTEFVQYAEDETPDALAYTHMVALLVKSIQEQNFMLQELKAEIEILKNK